MMIKASHSSIQLSIVFSALSLLWACGENKLTKAPVHLQTGDSDFPNDPTNVMVSAKTATELDIDWDADANVDGFRIVLQTEANSTDTTACSDTTATEVTANGGTHYTQKFSGLISSTAYQIRVCSIRSVTQGTAEQIFASDGTLISEKTYATSPDEVSHLVITKISELSPRISLSWSKVSGAKSYKIAYGLGGVAPSSCSPSSGNFQVNVLQKMDQPTIAIPLSARGQYAFRVCAVNLDAYPTETKGITGLISLSNLPAPTNLTLVPGQKSITANWKSGGGATSQFKISYATDPNFVIPGNTAASKIYINPKSNSKGTFVVNGDKTSYEMIALSSATPYIITVTAVNDLHEEHAAAAVTGKVLSTQIEEINGLSFLASPADEGFTVTPGYLASGGFFMEFMQGSYPPSNCVPIPFSHSIDATTLVFNHSYDNTVGIAPGSTISIRLCSTNSIHSIATAGVTLTIKMGSANGSTPAQVLAATGLCLSKTIPGHFELCNPFSNTFLPPINTGPPA